MPKKETPPKKTGPITRPKGTRDILNGEFFFYQGLFEKAAEIAGYYGFTPIETPILEREDLFTAGVGAHTDIVEKEMYTIKGKLQGSQLVLRPEGTAPVMRAYIENGLHTIPQPAMLYYFGPFFRHDKPQRGRYREFFQFGLEMLGSSHSISDAIIIHVTNLILKEAGFEETTVLINSIGCKECRAQYIKAVTTHYKKRVAALCPHCKIRIRHNALRLLDCKDESCKNLKGEAPEAIAYLCEGCKNHFKEVLEYIETLGITYRIDNTLVRGLDYYSRTVFEIVEENTRKEPEKEAPAEDKEKGGADPKAKEEETKKPNEPTTLAIAGGGRYDYLARALGSKRDVPSVGAAIGVDRIIASPSFKKISPRIVKKPKIYFIQIGFEAKAKSLGVIEALRKAKVPIVHSLSKDKLSIQLGMAEKSEIPFVIIIGQKEAMDGTVIVRKMSTRLQDTVKVEKLADYLKKHLGAK